jgi:GNAT superfamily N-acetyltransferase
LDLNIDNIDDNESSFCSLWSRTHEKIDCVELFLNPKLGDDYFFNRLNIKNSYSCHNITDILDSIKSSLPSYHDSLYVHLICNNENCIKFSLPKFGTMKILGLDLNKYALESESDHIEIDVIDKNHLYNWVDVFCRSFDSVHIKDEVTNIISKHYQKLTLLVAHYNLDQVKYFVGCCLLYEKKESIGLYCLGTIQHFRRKGVARELIARAVRIAKNNGHNLLIVQTLTKERYEEFYKKLGFRTIYEKMLYSFEIR